MGQSIDCPSAQPGARTSRIYGMLTGPADKRRVGYLTETLKPTPDLLALSGEAMPTELFRIAAPCANGACQHFKGSACTLAQRIVASLPAVVDALPPCQIRDTCRWFLQEGAPACFRCPAIATDKAGASETEVEAAGLDAAAGSQVMR